MSILESLNEEQRRAASYVEGPVAIIAGPGTGKTKTLTARIAYLIESKTAQPENILALTFTNKAAQEMQERTAVILGSESKGNASRPTIATFHALANMLVPLPAGSKFVSGIERTTILQVIKKSSGGKEFPMRDIGLMISRAKNQLSPSDAAITRLLEMYNAELETRNLYDYDDLLVGLYKALQHQVGPQHFTHILVDEFQDTNTLQYEIVRMLDKTGNIFVIGDPLQSIYGFRGADASIFTRFMRDYPHAFQVQLTTNYRSAPEIVQLANAMFPGASILHPHRTKVGIAQTTEVLNEYSEADWIINTIERQVGGSDMARSSVHHTAAGQRTFDNFAIMYRTHNVARTVQTALEKSGIPYQIAGEGSPYTKPYATAIIQSMAYLSGLVEAPIAQSLTPSQTKVLLEPLKAQAKDMKLSQLAHKITEVLGLSSEKQGSGLKQFTNTLLRFDDWTPAAYVRHIEKLAEQDYYDPNAGTVTLLTIHAAKGLEFPVVFLIAAEEGIVPLVRRGKTTDVDEERRLMYVAITRARDELHILHAQKRKRESQAISAFLANIPAGVLARTTDPDMAQQAKRLHRRAQKRAQSTLF